MIRTRLTFRKHQKKPVTVLNLIAEDTIEHRMLGVLDAKRTLADGVLDLRGNLEEVPLRPGGQTFVQRLEQTLSTAPVVVPPAAPAKAVAPPDPAAAFARRAAAILGSRLLGCEERFPDAGAGGVPGSPVLVAIVDREAEAWQPRLESVYAELFPKTEKDRDEGVPRLEVIDQTTARAIARLESAGIVRSCLRAVRRLHPGGPEEASCGALSAAEQASALKLHEQAAKRIKLARFLLAEELSDEALAALREAARLTAAERAVRQRLGREPATPAEALCAPHDRGWAADLETVRRLLSDAAEAADLVRALAVLERT